MTADPKCARTGCNKQPTVLVAGCYVCNEHSLLLGTVRTAGERVIQTGTAQPPQFDDRPIHVMPEGYYQIPDSPHIKDCAAYSMKGSGFQLPAGAKLVPCGTAKEIKDVVIVADPDALGTQEEPNEG